MGTPSHCHVCGALSRAVFMTDKPGGAGRSESGHTASVGLSWALLPLCDHLQSWGSYVPHSPASVVGFPHPLFKGGGRQCLL